MEGARGLVQARFLVAVLLLEMLGAQEQSLTPQQLRWHVHYDLAKKVFAGKS
jgi:hypothetical protein